MPTYTPNFNLAKPTVSGDVDTWGALLNGNFDTIDTHLQTALNVTGANVGAGTGLFESKASNQLRFKSLQPAATTNTAITSDADEVFLGRTDEQTDVRGNLRDIPVNVQNAPYTFTSTDHGRSVVKTDNNSYTWTLPTDATASWRNGAAITIVNDTGVGTITVTPAGGVTLVDGASVGSFILPINSGRTLLRISANRWRVF